MAWAFRDSIHEAIDGDENSILLRRVDAAIAMLENGLRKLEENQQEAIPGRIEMLQQCSVDLDYIFATLDTLKVPAGACGSNIRLRRKQLVERANVAAEKVETMHAFLLQTTKKPSLQTSYSPP